jgi:hypothetical protein
MSFIQSNPVFHSCCSRKTTSSISGISKRYLASSEVVVRPVVKTSSSSTTTTVDDRYSELVKETIKKMMLNRSTSDSSAENIIERKPISDDVLEAKFNYYKV